MPASQTLIKQARWRRTSSANKQAAFEDMTATWELSDLYPSREEKVGDAWVEKREILAHQQKLHEGLSLCGRRAVFTLFSGGVGSGKSLAMHVEMLSLLRGHPGIRIVVVCA